MYLEFGLKAKKWHESKSSTYFFEVLLCNYAAIRIRTIYFERCYQHDLLLLTLVMIFSKVQTAAVSQYTVFCFIFLKNSLNVDCRWEVVYCRYMLSRFCRCLRTVQRDLWSVRVLFILHSSLLFSIRDSYSVLRSMAYCLLIMPT